MQMSSQAPEIIANLNGTDLVWISSGAASESAHSEEERLNEGAKELCMANRAPKLSQPAYL